MERKISLMSLTIDIILVKTIEVSEHDIND